MSTASARACKGRSRLWRLLSERARAASEPDLAQGALLPAWRGVGARRLGPAGPERRERLGEHAGPVGDDHPVPGRTTRKEGKRQRGVGGVNGSSGEKVRVRVCVRDGICRRERFLVCQTKNLRCSSEEEAENAERRRVAAQLRASANVHGGTRTSGRGQKVNP